MNATDHAVSMPHTRWFLGTAIRILVSASDGNDDICVVEHVMPKGEAPPLHLHRNEDEIFVLLEGRVKVEIGGCIHQLEAGHAVVAPKGIAHGFVVESERARILTVTRGHDFETMLRSFSQPAAATGLPPATTPTPQMAEALTETCRRHNIDIVGPPIG